MIRWTLLFLIMIWLPHNVWAQKLSAFEKSNTESGPILEFTQGEFIQSSGIETPNVAWKRANNPNIYSRANNDWKTGDYQSLTGRFYFDRDELGDAPFAINVIGIRNQFTVSINGKEIFRNFAQPSDKLLAWNRPYLIPISSDILQQGNNEIIIHAISQESLGIGRVIIGPNIALQQYYDQQFFWRITAPKGTNFAMLLVGILVFLFWLNRKKETELLWLSISTVLQFIRNYHFYGEVTPFDLQLFIIITECTSYFSVMAGAAFYFYFIKLPYRFAIISSLLILGILLTIIFLITNTSSFIFYIPILMIGLSLSFFGIKDIIRYHNIERGLLGFFVLLTLIGIIYDIIMVAAYGGNGHAIYISVFNAPLYTIAFIISFGKRTLDAFLNIEKSNVVLEQRITETRAELAASEAERQKMVVGQAIADERGRLMQEMHDGIGSNLITALAVARNQNQSDNTIKTLNRAINDLKITVDSLEPIEGDLVALIGNLRHRMAEDLEDAGITCKWEVEDCKTLPWLDATNALHVLRIFQEAIGNVLTHSAATEIRIGCKETNHGGVAGITSYIADNGLGFDSSVQTQGKGVSNIHSRAKSLHGTLNYDTSIGVGTAITLWLPYKR